VLVTRGHRPASAWGLQYLGHRSRGERDKKKTPQGLSRFHTRRLFGLGCPSRSRGPQRPTGFQKVKGRQPRPQPSGPRSPPATSICFFTRGGCAMKSAPCQAHPPGGGHRRRSARHRYARASPSGHDQADHPLITPTRSRRAGAYPPFSRRNQLHQAKTTRPIGELLRSSFDPANEPKRRTSQPPIDRRHPIRLITPLEQAQQQHSQ